jgi:hypothetical protein
MNFMLLLILAYWLPRHALLRAIPRGPGIASSESPADLERTPLVFSRLWRLRPISLPPPCYPESGPARHRGGSCLLYSMSLRKHPRRQIGFDQPKLPAPPQPASIHSVPACEPDSEAFSLQSVTWGNGFVSSFLDPPCGCPGLSGGGGAVFIPVVRLFEGGERLSFEG